MTQLRQEIKTKRKLTQEQLLAFNDAANKFKVLAPRLARYESDEYIAGIYNDLVEKLQKMEAAKDEYLETPIIEYKTYDINEEDIEEVKQAIENFMKLIVLE